MNATISRYSELAASGFLLAPSQLACMSRLWRAVSLGALPADDVVEDRAQRHHRLGADRVVKARDVGNATPYVLEIVAVRATVRKIVNLHFRVDPVDDLFSQLADGDRLVAPDVENAANGRLRLHQPNDGVDDFPHVGEA